jgi:hypothetical protein
MKHVFKAKRSASPKFEKQWAAHKGTEQFVRNMSTNLHAYRDAMKTTQDTAVLVVNDIQQWVRDPAVRKKSPIMIPLTNSMHDCQHECDAADTKSIAFFNKSVLAPVDTFCRRMDDARRLVKELEERHSRFDYYNDKLEQLQRAKAARTEKGKQDSEKDLDKLARNQQKLDTARTDFNGQTKKVCAELLEIAEDKFGVFNPTIARLTEFKIMSTKLRYEQTERLRPRLQSPVQEGVRSPLGEDNNFVAAYEAAEARVAGVKVQSCACSVCYVVCTACGVMHNAHVLASSRHADCLVAGMRIG